MTKQGIPFSIAIILWFTLTMTHFIQQWLFRASVAPFFVPNDSLLFMEAPMAVFFAVSLAFGSYFLKKAELAPFAPRPLGDICYPAILYGIVLGLATAASSSFFFPLGEIIHLPKVHPVVSLIIDNIVSVLNSAILFLLCLLPFVLWLLRMIFSSSDTNQHKLIWPSILITEIVTSILIIKIAPSIGYLFSGIEMLPSIISGIVVGWLFFTNGFWAAVLASFVTSFTESISQNFSITTILMLLTLAVLALLYLVNRNPERYWRKL